MNRKSVRLTSGQINAITELVESGLYADDSAVIRDAIRHLIQHHQNDVSYSDIGFTRPGSNGQNQIFEDYQDGKP